MMTQKTYEKGKVSVVMYVYNEERFLREALESVVLQVDCVILGDNASTDGTEVICREYAKKYPHVDYFRNEQNIGLIRNGRKCFERITTEYVFIMGGHDILPAEYVSVLKDAIDSRPDVSCAHADALDFDQCGNTILRSFVKHTGFAEDSQNPNPYFRGHAFFAHWTAGCYWPPVFGLYRSDMIIPALREFPPISLCDVAFIFGALLKGKLLFVPHTQYRRRGDVHISKTRNAYSDNSIKRICGEIDTSSHMSGEMRYVRKVYEDTMDSEYAATKAYYGTLIARCLARVTGERTGEFWFDLYNRMWRRVLKPAWRHVCRYIKSSISPAYAKRKALQDSISNQ